MRVFYKEGRRYRASSFTIQGHRVIFIERPRPAWPMEKEAMVRRLRRIQEHYDRTGEVGFGSHNCSDHMPQFRCHGELFQCQGIMMTEDNLDG